MKDSAYKISLDINGNGSQLVLNARHMDTGRKLYVSLRSGGEPYIIEKNCYAAFTAAKPDGTDLYNACDIEGNEIVYEFTEQTCSVIGRSRCEIILYGPDDKVITSPRFALLVDGTICPEGKVVSTDEFTALTHATSEAIEATGSANDAAAKANTAATVALGAAEDANTATVDAEDAAKAASTAAQNANTATEAANQAASAATQSAQFANTAAGDARHAAEDADSAAASANQAAQSANSASINANQATSAATQATKNANTATENANGAAQSANTAADSANTATENANGATNRANEATQAANSAASDANLAAENANVTISNVSRIVKNTMAAGKVSGDSVTMNDAVAFDFIGCRIFGKTTQDGTPTPDAPIDLVSIGDSGSITVNVTGENEAQSMTIATPNGLPGVPVISGGNYTDANGQQWICDEIDFARGVYVQRVRTLMFNGSESWQMYSYQNANYGFNIYEVLEAEHTRSRGLCNQFEVSSGVNNCVWVGVANKHLYVITREWYNKGLDAWKTHLSAKPLNIVYLLATPTEAPLSEEELAAYAALHTYRGNTTVSNDASAHMEIEYVMDAKKYIDSQVAGIHTATVE